LLASGRNGTQFVQVTFSNRNESQRVHDVYFGQHRVIRGHKSQPKNSAKSAIAYVLSSVVARCIYFSMQVMTARALWAEADEIYSSTVWGLMGLR
jgi:hypothetical protein